MSFTSRWFLAAFVILLGVIAGSVWWYVNRPGPRILSEQIVREFSKSAGAEVRDFRRALRQAKGRGKSGDDPAAMAEKIAAITAETLERIEGLADEAVEKLGGIPALPLGTEKNREDRIQQRLREAKDTVAGIRDEAMAELRGRGEPAAAGGETERPSKKR